ncbi:MAG TPA: hypothetical protein VNO52_12790, partial [Methylomirabilota bacterium]|nr:hypothetical protein [Methylomirabilota bacterium]
MKTKLITGLVMVAGGLLVGNQNASAKNITIYDGASTPGPWTGIGRGGEDQEVEHPAVPGQEWDLETFQLNGTKLTLTGGYNFVSGQGKYRPGDIFIDVNDDAVYGTPIGVGNNGTINNSLFKYDYVLRFNHGANGLVNLNYDIIAIGNDSLLEVAFPQTTESNPWRYRGGGTVVGSGTAVFASGLTDAQADATGGDGSHYSLTVDIGFLGVLTGDE